LSRLKNGEIAKENIENNKQQQKINILINKNQIKMSAENFELAAEEVQNFFKAKGETSDDNKLALYSLYK